MFQIICCKEIHGPTSSARFIDPDVHNAPRSNSMISQRKMEANRRNATKSTGPRTAEGKDKVKFNAVTHGFTAATVVLPHEDEEAYQDRLEDWTRELDAPGKLGRYLVERVVRISWQLDRADTFEQAKLAKRIQDAPRRFADCGAEPAEILFARLLGTEAQPASQKPALTHGARRAGPVPVNSPALLLRELESSAEGCRRLLDEWTQILDSLGSLGPEGIASTEFHSRRDNIKRALQLVGVPFRDPEDPPVTTTDPLTAPFVRAWQALNDQVMIEALGQEIEDDDWPAALEREAELDRPYWAAVGVALLKLATERRARLKTMLARHQEGEEEARPRLAAEASFDDSAEGERVHRYQERWGRALLKTLGEIHLLRERGEAVVGPESPPDEGWMSRACMRLAAEESERQESFEPAEEASGGEECVRDLTSDFATPVCDEPSSSEAEAGPECGDQEEVTNQRSPARQKENGQNKPTAERKTLVHKGLCAHVLVARKSTGERRTDPESGDSGDKSDAHNGHALRRFVPLVNSQPSGVWCS
jgi:hypothetical protein